MMGIFSVCPQNESSENDKILLLLSTEKKRNFLTTKIFPIEFSFLLVVNGAEKLLKTFVRCLSHVKQHRLLKKYYYVTSDWGMKNDKKSFSFS